MQEFLAMTIGMALLAIAGTVGEPEGRLPTAASEAAPPASLR